MTFKDLFSERSDSYSRYRPKYPAALFEWLSQQVPARELAVDVGAGNGQAAWALGAHFQRVIAFDPSAAQLQSAAVRPNLEYRVAPAETLNLDAGVANLVTAAQAFHWFNADAFFTEVRRVVQPGGVLAVWCYPLHTIAPDVDRVVQRLYSEFLDDYWEPERRLVEQGYSAVQFPFAEILAPAFEMQLTWTLDDLVGYLGTWSALKKCIRENGTNPLVELTPELSRAWGDEPARTVSWSLSVRAFRC
jgi:SAM-dependent methyltransferase